jgi:hypothetical protein
MKRVIQKVGSRKWCGDDWITIQNEALAATEAHFKDYGAHVLTGCIVSGTDISAGVVIIDGKACRYQGESSITFPRYLVKQETEVDNENYETGGSKATYNEIYAVGQSSAPGSGEYVTIQSSGSVRKLMDVIRDNHDHPASAITSGVLEVARIPNLDAGKISSGTFANARISSASVVQHLGNYVNRSSNQNIGGNKNFTSRIGLNIQNPDYPIHIGSQSADSVGFFLGANTSVTGAGILLGHLDNDTVSFIGARFSNENFSAINIVRANRNVGINVLNPIEKFEVGGNIKATGSIIGNISASNVNSGILAVARIPNLEASKITSGTFDNARISSGSVIQHLVNYVDRSTNQTIGGIKSFSSDINVNTLKINSQSAVALIEFTRPSYNYIQASAAGGSFQFIVNGESIGLSNSVLSIGPNKKIGIKNQEPEYDLDVTGSIRATGNVFSNSDRKLKTKITNVSGALSKALKINACYFNWKDPKHGEGRQFGLIAQEVEKVLPEVVTTDGNGVKSLAYNKLSALLFTALKELNEKVESLNN